MGKREKMNGHRKKNNVWLQNIEQISSPLATYFRIFGFDKWMGKFQIWRKKQP